MSTLTFVWPQEPYLPTSLFKHFVYLGESAAYARKFGNVNLIDLSVDQKSKSEVLGTFERSDAVLVPVEAYNVRNGIKLAALAKSVGTTTVAYGTIASMNPKILSQYFDAVISTGHWEKAIEKLSTSKTSFFQSLHDKQYTEAEPLSGSEWVHPPLDILPLSQYNRISPGQLEINVQKGCLYNCSFCAEKDLIPEKRIYQREPNSTAKFLLQNPGFNFYLDATTFTQDRGWAEETCKAISQVRPLRKWRTVTRVDQLDENIARTMADAGCYKVGLGIESLFTSTQRYIRKIINEDKILMSINLLRNVGIIPRVFLMLGIPGQTKEEVRYCLDFLDKNKIESRWKEYIPLDKIHLITSLSEFEQFERNNYQMHKIPGLSEEEYIRILSIKR